VNAERVIVASETGALIVNVWGDLARQSDPRLPRPRAIVGTFIFYGLMGLVAGFGDNAARFAASSSVVLFLVTLVGNGVKGSGEGGRSLIDLLGATTRLITGAPAASGNTGAAPAPSTGG
jgi:hypothetical protein